MPEGDGDDLPKHSGRRVNVYWKATGEIVFDDVWPSAISSTNHSTSVVLCEPPDAKQVWKAHTFFAAFGRETQGGCVRRLLFRDGVNGLVGLRRGGGRRSAFADERVVETKKKCLEMVCGENERFVVCVAESREEHFGGSRRRVGEGIEVDEEKRERFPDLKRFVEESLKHFEVLQKNFEENQLARTEPDDPPVTSIDQRDNESTKYTGGSTGKGTTSASQPTGSSDPLTIDAQADSSTSAHDASGEADGPNQPPKQAVKRAPMDMVAISAALQLIRNSTNL